ncbi:hypothetical protein DET56_110119 [Paenibacillus pabuli]|uniref:Uncharacterized protein n=1 Tax=Paenibacillus pabuli TaxID=1472 RepID=A0A855Y2L6_9BACL|nr:hypothetical protein DET56_110119 [Paenibacillus pabuli]PXW04213.1 hypothetical protein DEU73_109179 [Paenibacillus taichungensis]
MKIKVFLRTKFIPGEHLFVFIEGLDYPLNPVSSHHSYARGPCVDERIMATLDSRTINRGSN